MEPATKVINVRTCQGNPKRIDGLVYVGRAARGGWQKSPYHNPFKPNYGDDKFLTALDCVLMYVEQCLVRRAQAPDYLPELRRKLTGKYLGCWCVEWNPSRYVFTPCHAIPLALVADGAAPAGVALWLREVRRRYAEEGEQPRLTFADFAAPPVEPAAAG